MQVLRVRRRKCIPFQDQDRVSFRPARPASVHWSWSRVVAMQRYLIYRICSAGA